VTNTVVEVAPATFLRNYHSIRFIDSPRFLLEDMRSNGYWLSDELIQFAAKQCGEEKAG